MSEKTNETIDDIKDNTLKNYVFQTSHNTYLYNRYFKWQFLSLTSPENLKRFLKDFPNVRFIELDIHSHDKDLYVSHKFKFMQFTTKSKFTDMLNVIRNNIDGYEPYSDHPFFIYLDIYEDFNEEFLNLLNYQIFTTLGHKTVNIKSKLTDLDINQIKNKIVILTNSHKLRCSEFTYYVLNSDNNKNVQEKTDLIKHTLEDIFHVSGNTGGLQQIKSILSFNYDPIPLLRAGCHFVSMNYQSHIKNYNDIFQGLPMIHRSVCIERANNI